MDIKNQISQLIKQQFHIEYNGSLDPSFFLVCAMHEQAANEISNSIASCIVYRGDCQVAYQQIARSFYITSEEIERSDIEAIKNKIKEASEREIKEGSIDKGGEFHQLLSKFHQSLEEHSKLPFFQLLNISAEQMLKDFFDKFCPSYGYKADAQDSGAGEFSDIRAASDLSSSSSYSDSDSSVSSYSILDVDNT